MPLHDGLIFDLDGTLWDSTEPVARAWHAAAESLEPKPAKRIDRESVAGIMGMTHEQIFQLFYPHVALDERERIAAICYAAEEALLRREGALWYPGVQAGLRELSKTYRLFLVSNCQTNYLSAFFEWSGMQPLFRDSECHGNTGKRKSENITSVCRRNELRNAAYIGDTAGDEREANEAGVTYYHVDYGFGKAIGECRHFENFSSLVNCFLPTKSK